MLLVVWPRGGTVLSTVEEYDPKTNTWTKKANMPTPRVALSTSAVNGKIYAIGGYDKFARALSIVVFHETSFTTKDENICFIRSLASCDIISLQRMLRDKGRILIGT
jgi:hypothetical protein